MDKQRLTLKEYVLSKIGELALMELTPSQRAKIIESFETAHNTTKSSQESAIYTCILAVLREEQKASNDEFK